MGKGNIQYINKTIYGRLNDCEAHIYFLGEALDKYYAGEQFRYKQAVGEMRVLAADNTKKNNGLLINLLKDLDLTYTFDYDKKKVTLQEYLNDFGAVLNKKTFTKAELIREIAQNEGSSHESKSLPDHLALGHSFKINGLSIHIKEVMGYGYTIRNVGKELIKYMRNNFNYQVQYLEFN